MALRIQVLRRFPPVICALFSFMAPQSKLQATLLGRVPAPLSWRSAARLRQRLRSSPGDLIFSGQGVEFRSAKGPAERWAFVEIKAIDLRTPGRLSLTSYQNRSWHRGGDRQLRFEVTTPIPPAAAAQLIERVGKPAINGDPDPRAPAYATIPARHRTRFGGSNGVLRFRSGGVDYIAFGGRNSRSWRWADIQTLASSDPYQLRVAGYLETFDFELKEPLSRQLFDRLWDQVYARGLNLGQAPKGELHAQR